MTVYFIGAGPGDPDLITVKGQRLIAQCPVCIYAGSLVPEDVIASAPEDALIMDSASMNLEEIMEIVTKVHNEGKDIARVHSGDPSIYGAIAEQIERLKNLDIPFEIVPGVPAFAAAAAAFGQELTIPKISQTLILTRTSMKSTDMPEDEDLAILGASKATLIIHLSVRNSLAIQRKLIPHYGEDCPVIIAYRIGWTDQQIIRTNLQSLRDEIRAYKFTRTVLIFVGKSLDPKIIEESALYDKNHSHILRFKKRTPQDQS
ncbi:MAG: precorrin-4 C(11)-methyltransferase [Rhodobacteraceae bacterium]|nr:precorrin-4 C(11)-methyltransferase [Paracoccaceae bacterium]MYF46619.1 precorrin-4 C(11)-methyltransferase [Paracoccaceae bacterium]MYI91379.1 precorrin-4 C(11)-methyltransferase [Paracoccaceae bacterium]